MLLYALSSSLVTGLYRCINKATVYNLLLEVNLNRDLLKLALHMDNPLLVLCSSVFQCTCP